jgi:signal transduction histidine kinase
LEHVAAQARLRAELADLVASRRRIIENANAERRRLERGVHDGAQQRGRARRKFLPRGETFPARGRDS